MFFINSEDIERRDFGARRISGLPYSPAGW
jgi:hypothetical protein